jgi:hypothetical protein
VLVPDCLRLRRPDLADTANFPLNHPEKTTTERQCHDGSR